MADYIAMVIYDLPMNSKKTIKAYTKFRKALMKTGFYMIQESVYIKRITSTDKKHSLIYKLNRIKPDKGDVRLLIFTLNQYLNCEYVLGEFSFSEKIITNKVSVN